jgi:hypothetical protein
MSVARRALIEVDQPSNCLSQKRADHDRTNRNPYGGKTAHQKTGLRCGADTTPKARM